MILTHLTTLRPALPPTPPANFRDSVLPGCATLTGWCRLEIAILVDLPPQNTSPFAPSLSCRPIFHGGSPRQQESSRLIYSKLFKGVEGVTVSSPCYISLPKLMVSHEETLLTGDLGIRGSRLVANHEPKSFRMDCAICIRPCCFRAQCTKGWVFVIFSGRKMHMCCFLTGNTFLKVQLGCPSWDAEVEIFLFKEK